MTNELLQKARAGPVLMGAAVGAAVQVLAVVLVQFAWRQSTGGWGSWEWSMYILGFCVVAPLVGMLAVRVAANLGVTQVALGTAVIGLLNGLFAISAHGFEDAGVQVPVYVGGYGVLVATVFALIATRRRGR